MHAHFRPKRLQFPHLRLVFFQRARLGKEGVRLAIQTNRLLRVENSVSQPNPSKMCVEYFEQRGTKIPRKTDIFHRFFRTVFLQAKRFQKRFVRNTLHETVFATAPRNRACRGKMRRHLLAVIPKMVYPIGNKRAVRANFLCVLIEIIKIRILPGIQTGTITPHRRGGSHRFNTVLFEKVKTYLAYAEIPPIVYD